jgi:hypothetical protein
MKIQDILITARTANLEGYDLPMPTPRARVESSDGRMNKTEAAYAGELEIRRLAGEIAWYRFEAIKLRLAAKTFYTPDFLVVLADGEVQFHEVKGFWRDDARVKIKVAAEQFPFVFIAIHKTKGGWETEYFGRRKG